MSLSISLFVVMESNADTFSCRKGLAPWSPCNSSVLSTTDSKQIFYFSTPTIIFIIEILLFHVYVRSEWVQLTWICFNLGQIFQTSFFIIIYYIFTFWGVHKKNNRHTNHHPSVPNTTLPYLIFFFIIFYSPRSEPWSLLSTFISPRSRKQSLQICLYYFFVGLISYWSQIHLSPFDVN